MMLKKATALGVAGLLLGASSAAAGSISDGTTVALTMVGGGGLMALGCMATAILTRNDEEEEEGYGRRGFYVGLGPTYARENFSDSAVLNLFDGELNDNLQGVRGTPVLEDLDAKPPILQDGDPGNYSFSVSDIDSDAFGASGRVGYRCHPYISSELQFEVLSDFDGAIDETTVNTWPSAADDVLRNFDLDLETLVFTVNAKGHLMTGRYQPFVLAGLGFMRMETKAYDKTSQAALDAAGRDRAPQASDRRVEVAARFGGGIDFYITENWVATAEASYLLPTGKLEDMDYYSIGLGLQYRF
jgi:opacity protein-like surface antigen